MKKPLVDSPSPLTITVTKRHITMGIPCNPLRCALALAGKDKMKQALSVEVLHSVVKVEFDDVIFRYRSPYVAQEFLRQLDRNGGVRPGTYTFAATAGTRSSLSYKKKYDQSISTGKHKVIRRGPQKREKLGPYTRSLTRQL